ncbi:unnamed protein product, partial [Vitis vinifera]
MKLQILGCEFESFFMNDIESISTYFDRMQTIVSVRERQWRNGSVIISPRSKLAT